MSDPTLTRLLAGPLFRRADTTRDERAGPPLRKAEDFFVNLAGWLPPRRDRAASVARLAQAVAAARAPLQSAADEQVALALHRAVAALAALSLHQGRPADQRGGRLLAPGPAGWRSAPALHQALACVALGCERRLGLQSYPVQLAGARSLLLGELAEMQTGEGKTLVAALAATVMAASGARVHVISTNDYLARRDSDEMAPLFGFFGLAAGCIQGGMSPLQRRHAYAQPVCYASGKEVVFDYLKDRLAGHGVVPARVSSLHALVADPTQAVAAPLIPALHFAIVDEADSVLIDEARTPMILSREAPPAFAPDLLSWAIDSARGLVAGRHFSVTGTRDVELRPGAREAALPLPASAGAAWHSRNWSEHLLRQALVALHLFHLDQHYIISDSKVQIVDESTGRVMPDRSWENGLHQLIETKEGLVPSNGRETLARMTYQRFFRRYYLLAGLTGTAAESARELWSVYRLRVRRIPPNRPKRIVRGADRCLPTLQDKWQAVADAACAAALRGQPVLVGTRSVLASEQVSAALQQRGVAHVVLNARQDAEEAQIVAQAGSAGRITVATNMAGRGTDIKLDAAALAAGGLHVILTEFHDSPRVDRQLFGRSARQGEPGTAQAIVSGCDALFDHQPKPLKAALRSGRPPAALVRWVLQRAQALAERRAVQARLATLKQDKELHRMIGIAGRVT